MDVIIFLQTKIIATNFLIMENKNKKTLEFLWPYKRKNYLLASGYTIHAFVNSAGKPTKPPKSILDSMKKYFKN